MLRLAARLLAAAAGARAGRAAAPRRLRFSWLLLAACC